MPYSYYVHYSTVKGDALGKLIITECEVIFEPLNKSLKGFINQTQDDFFNNKKLSFSIAYEDLKYDIDICSIPSRKNSETDEISINYFVQLDLFHTGYFYYTDEETKKVMLDLKKKNKPLARVNIKMNNFNLLDEKMTNA